MRTIAINIPKGWNAGRIKDFFVLQRGFDITERHAKKGIVPVISSSGFAYYHNKAKVSGPGIVTGRKGKIGKVFYIKEDFWPHDTTLWVKDFSGNDPEYIQIFLQHLKLERFDEASSVPTLNRNYVHKQKCVFPPFPEQKAIANLLSTWDEAIDKTEQLIDKKEKRFKWVINSLINSKGNWATVRLGEICSVTKGKQLNVAHMKDDGDYYALNGGIEPSGRTDDWNTEAETVTISEGGNSCGYVNYNVERFWSGGHCYSLLNLKNNVYKHYLYFYLKMNEPKLMKLRVGSGLPNIQKKDVKKFIVALPTFFEQQQIAETLSLVRQEIDLLKQFVEKYKLQKRGLVRKMLTGEWRVKPEVVKKFEEVR